MARCYKGYRVYEPSEGGNGRCSDCDCGEKPMATNCLKCTYTKGDKAEDRACTKCGRPKNVGKGQWPPQLSDGRIYAMVSQRRMVEEEGYPGSLVPVECSHVFSLEEMVGKAHPTAATADATAPSDATAVAPAAELVPVGYTLADMIGAGETPPENPPLAPVQPAGAGSDGSPIPAVSIPSSAPAAATPETWENLPEHSPKGGSGAKRWMNCKGSYGLIEALRKQGVEVNEGSEYAKRGTLIHTVAEACLTRDVDVWEIQTEFPDFGPEDWLGTQQYVNYVRALPGRKSYEQTYHLPKIHKYFYGKLDTERYTINPGPDDVVLEVVDLKAGAGVYVDEIDNYQIKYYLALAIMADPEYYGDAAKVRGTIAQPFVTWADEQIRSWDTTVGEIKRWVAEELLPALEDESSTEFVMGDWCQFCPAKLHCPAQKAATEEIGGWEGQSFEDISDAELGRRYELFEKNRTVGKALSVEVHKRLMDRKTIPGAKLVLAKAERVWKEKLAVGEFEETLEQQAVVAFGANAYTPQKLLSPAQMEKLPGGPTFVATWAYKPDAGYTIALDSDRRRAVTAKSGSELFANTVKHLDTSAA